MQQLRWYVIAFVFLLIAALNGVFQERRAHRKAWESLKAPCAGDASCEDRLEAEFEACFAENFYYAPLGQTGRGRVYETGGSWTGWTDLKGIELCLAHRASFTR